MLSYLLVLSPMALTYLSHPSTMGSHLSASPQPDSPALIWPWLWFSPSLSEMGHTPHPHTWVTAVRAGSRTYLPCMVSSGCPGLCPFSPQEAGAGRPGSQGPSGSQPSTLCFPCWKLCYFSFLSKLTSVEQPQRPTGLSQTLPARLNNDTEVY